jgi:hypothetical protein
LAGVPRRLNGLEPRVYFCFIEAGAFLKTNRLRELSLSGQLPNVLRVVRNAFFRLQPADVN